MLNKLDALDPQIWRIISLSYTNRRWSIVIIHKDNSEERFSRIDEFMNNPFSFVSSGHLKMNGAIRAGLKYVKSFQRRTSGKPFR